MNEPMLGLVVFSTLIVFTLVMWKVSMLVTQFVFGFS